MQFCSCAPALNGPRELREPLFRRVLVPLDDSDNRHAVHRECAGATEVRLTRLADELRANCVHVITEVVVDSHPPQCIVTYAERQQIDLVALSTHSRGALGRAVMGATADKVVRGASTPVLVFHPGGRGAGAAPLPAPSAIPAARIRRPDHPAPRADRRRWTLSVRRPG